MEIQLEIVYAPALPGGGGQAPARLRVHMTQPGFSEPELKDYEGDAAEQLFAGLFAQIQEARLRGQLSGQG